MIQINNPGRLLQRVMLFRNTLHLSTKHIVIALLIMIGLFQNTVAFATESKSLEVKIKAAYLYNFLRFVEWPKDDLQTSNICVYGIKDSYQAAFSSMATITKQNQKLSITQYNISDDLESLTSCQIIFITDKAAHQSKAVLDYVKGSHSLTIGESSEFIKNGGMINFIHVKDKIRFEINPDAAEAAGLKISSKVLRIAERLIGLNNHD
jgi:YfiR/HmsC-like